MALKGLIGGTGGALGGGLVAAGGLLLFSNPITAPVVIGGGLIGAATGMYYGKDAETNAEALGTGVAAGAVSGVIVAGTVLAVAAAKDKDKEKLLTEIKERLEKKSKKKEEDEEDETTQKMKNGIATTINHEPFNSIPSKDIDLNPVTSVSQVSKPTKRRRRRHKNKYIAKERRNGGHQHASSKPVYRSTQVTDFEEERKKNGNDRPYNILAGFHGVKDQHKKYSNKDPFVPLPGFAERDIYDQAVKQVEKTGANAKVFDMTQDSHRQKFKEEGGDDSVLLLPCYGTDNPFYEDSMQEF